MGQRLVVTIYKDETRLCNIYYHWSAYTISSLMEAKNILDNCIYDCNSEIEDLRLRLIRFVEANGGCISGGEKSKEFKYVKKLYPNEVFMPTGSRNNGLIALSEDEMNSNYSWAEGMVELYLDSETLYTSAYWYDSLEGLREAYESDDTPPQIDVNLNEEIAFCDLNDTIDKLENLSGYVFVNNGCVFGLIA